MFSDWNHVSRNEDISSDDEGLSAIPDGGVPVVDVNMEFRQLLVFPPSNAGEQAMVALSSLGEWTEARSTALARMQEAQEELSLTVQAGIDRSKEHSRIISTTEKHRQVCQRWRLRIKEKKEEVEKWYNQFVKYDAMVAQAQRTLASAYDTYMLSVSFDESRNVDSDDEEAQRKEREALLRAQMETKDEGDISDSEVGAFLFAAAADQPLLQQSAKATNVVMKIVRIQATFKARKRRRQLKSLNRIRRIFRLSTLHYHFFYWRVAAKGLSFYRKRLQRLAFWAMLGAANMASMRRSIFALRFDRCRTIATARRTLEVWYRYTKFLNAPIDPETRERLVTFDEPMPLWDAFVEAERQKVAMQQTTSFLVKEDPDMIKARFMRKWKKYVARRREKFRKWVFAEAHHDICSMRRHFGAWLNMVSYSAQKTAADFATKQYYMEKWRQEVRQAMFDRQRLKAFIPVKKMTTLTRWRKQVVELRKQQASAMMFLQGNRFWGLFSLSVIQKDSQHSTFYNCWYHWKDYAAHRTLWKVYIGVRWHKRTEYLKRLCFRAWKDLLTPEKESSVIKSNRSFTGKDLVSTGMRPTSIAMAETSSDLIEEYTNTKYRVEYLKWCARINAINALLEDPGGFEANIFAKEVVIEPADEIRYERRGARLQYEHWSRCHASGMVDHQLMYSLVSLLVHMNEQRKRNLSRAAEQQFDPLVGEDTASVASTDTSSSPIGAEDSVASGFKKKPVDRALYARRMIHAMVALCAGHPIYNVRKFELNVAQMELYVKDASQLNFVYNCKRSVRDGRLLRKIESRIAALRLFNVSPFFTCEPLEAKDIGFSPYRALMEEYNNIMAQNLKPEKKGKSKQGKLQSQHLISTTSKKYAIPIDPPPKRRWLPYLMRLHLHDFIGENQKRRIKRRKETHRNVMRAVLMTKLSSLVLARRKVQTEETLKRQITIARTTLSEYKELASENLQSKYHTLIPVSCRVLSSKSMDVLHYSLLNLIGFNPMFLRGQLQADIRKQRALRAEMKLFRARMQAAGVLRADHDGDPRSALRRTISEVGGVRIVEIAEERGEALKKFRRKSLPSLVPLDPFGLMKSPRESPCPSNVEVVTEHGEDGERDSVEGGGTRQGDGDDDGQDAALLELLKDSDISTIQKVLSMNALLDTAEGGSAAGSDRAQGSRLGSPQESLTGGKLFSGDIPASGSDTNSPKGQPSSGTSLADQPSGTSLGDSMRSAQRSGKNENMELAEGLSKALSVASSATSRHSSGKSLGQSQPPTSGRRGSEGQSSVVVNENFVEQASTGKSALYTKTNKLAKELKERRKKKEVSGKLHEGEDEDAFLNRVMGERQAKKLEQEKIHVAALEAPKIALKVKLESKSEKYRRMMEALERQRALEEKYKQQVAVQSVGCPRLWASDSQSGTVRSLDRLLELSARYSNYINARSRAYLDDLKLKLYSLVDDPARNAALEGLQKQNAQFEDQEGRLQIAVTPAEAPGVAAEAQQRPVDTPSISAESPSKKAPVVRKPRSSPPGRRPNSQSTKSSSLPFATSASSTQETTSKKEGAKIHAVPASAEEQFVMVDTEPVRRQVLHVPRMVGEDGVHRMMKSTATLMNDIRPPSDLSLMVATVDDVEKLRRHQRSNTPASAQRPWRDVARPAPRPESVDVKEMFRSTDLEKKRLASEKRQLEAQAARRFVLMREKEKASEKATTELRTYGAPPDEEAEFQAWVTDNVKKLRDYRTFDGARENLTAERSLVGRKMQRLTALHREGGNCSESRALLRELRRRDAAIEQLLMIKHPLQSEGLHPLDACIFKQSAAVPTDRKHSRDIRSRLGLPLASEGLTSPSPVLSEAEVGRLVSLVVQSKMSES